MHGRKKAEPRTRQWKISQERIELAAFFPAAFRSIAVLCTAHEYWKILLSLTTAKRLVVSLRILPAEKKFEIFPSSPMETTKYCRLTTRLGSYKVFIARKTEFFVLLSSEFFMNFISIKADRFVIWRCQKNIASLVTLKFNWQLEKFA